MNYYLIGSIILILVLFSWSTISSFWPIARGSRPRLLWRSKKTKIKPATPVGKPEVVDPDEYEPDSDLRPICYQTWLENWISARLETDRQMVRLPTLAMGGLLAVILSGGPWLLEQRWYLGASTLLFMLTATARIWIMHRNTDIMDYRLDEAVDPNNIRPAVAEKFEPTERLITALSKFSYHSFLLAILAAAMFIFSILIGGPNMGNESKMPQSEKISRVAEGVQGSQKTPVKKKKKSEGTEPNKTSE